MPCGNLSNVAAAAMARKMGAPLGSITGACSPGMFADVMAGHPIPEQNPSNSYPANMPRIMALYGGDMQNMRREINAKVFSPSQQEDAVRFVYEHCGYIAEPRSASAIATLLQRRPVQKQVWHW